MKPLVLHFFTFLFLVMCSLPPVLAGDASGEGSEIKRLQSELEQDPGNATLRFHLARAYNFDGQHERAARLFRELVKENPENADYLLGFGQAWLWNGQAEKAVPHLEKAAALAPEYEDVYRTLAQAYEQTGDTAAARALYRDARQRFDSPDWAHPDILSLAAADFPGFSLYLGNRSEDLDYNPDNWRRTRLALTRHFDERRSLTVFAEDSEHFNLDDKLYGISAVFPLPARTYAITEISASPTHRFTWKYSLYGQLGHSLPGGWGVLAGLRHREYSDATVNILDATVEKYVGNYRLAYTLFFSDSDTAGSAMSHRLQAGYYFSERNSVQLAVTTGEEVDKIVASNQVVRTEFTDVSLWGELWLDRNLSLEYGIGYTDLSLPVQGDSHRKHIQLGINYYF